jgi:hypothetical protein
MLPLIQTSGLLPNELIRQNITGIILHAYRYFIIKSVHWNHGANGIDLNGKVVESEILAIKFSD